MSGALPPATPHCGVADAVVKIAQILVSKSVDVAIFTSRKSGTTIGGEQSENVKIFNLATSWGFRDLGTFLRTVRTWAPDLVHIQYPTQDYGRSWMPYFLPFILFLLRVRVVQTWHENTRFRFLPNLFSRDWLIVVEADFLKKLRWRYKWAMIWKNINFIQIVSNIDRVILPPKKISALRARFLKHDSERLLVFFGFLYEGKGFEKILNFADPTTDRLLIIGNMEFETNPYHSLIQSMILSGPWRDRVSFLGYLNSSDAAEIISVSDAMLCPFDNGMRDNNGTVLAGQAQGVFVLTTKQSSMGYDPCRNTYFAACNDENEMKMALDRYFGVRVVDGNTQVVDWERFVVDHLKVYQKAIRGV